MKFVLILSFFVLSVLAEKTEGEREASEVEDIGLVHAFVIKYLSIFVPWQCPHASHENMQKERGNAIECVKNISFNSTYCDTFVHHFKPCLQGLLDKVKKCDDPNFFLFKNTLDSFIEEAKYICNVDGEHILEISNSCVVKSVKMSYECRKNITAPIEDRKNPLTLCRGFPSLLRCFESQMQQECGNELTRTTLHDLFSVDVEPCNTAMMIYFEIVEMLR
ncbi:uncharacterized protein LOC123313473 [Coccinella septempunctata]|uniref:uncharacterized protein LOC123313473 n=1 Tax=Coccinella septempunctata TaxID=41139 RepID=UPI001D09485C|nr:uncharacterized protein LOC123313473 [Coccinella septempunctata]